MLADHMVSWYQTRAAHERMATTRVGEADVIRLFEEFATWVRTERPHLLGALRTYGGDVQGWVGDALLWDHFQRAAKVYKIRGELSAGEDVALSAFVLGPDLARSGALEVDSRGAWVRAPVISSAQAPVVYPAGQTPKEVRGVPAFKVVDILHEHVDLSALTEPTRAYLRSYLAAYVEDEPESGDDALLAAIETAVRAVPATHAGIMGLLDYAEQARMLVGEDEWEDHPLRKVIEGRIAAIQRPTVAVVDEDVTPKAGETPTWAARWIDVARGADVLARLAHHGQAAMRLSTIRRRGPDVVITWTSPDRSLSVTIEPPAASGSRLFGDFTTTSGVRVPEKAWRARAPSLNVLLPDGWLDRIREAAPAQAVVRRWEDAGRLSEQRRALDSIAKPEDELAMDSFGRVYVFPKRGAARLIDLSGKVTAFPMYAERPAGLTRLLHPERKLALVERMAVADDDAPMSIFMPVDSPVERLEASSIPPQKAPKNSMEGFNRNTKLAEWEKKSTRLYNRLRDLGYRLDTLLGCGSYGCAYAGRPYVLKLTSDAAEAANAEVMRHLDIPGMVRIYAVLAASDIPKVYAIVTEPLESVSRAVAKWVDEWRIDHERYLLDTGYSTLAEYKAKVAGFVASAPDGVDAEPYVAAVDALYKNGIAYHDGHGDNVMRRGDTLVLIDLGFSNSPGADVLDIA